MSGSGGSGRGGFFDESVVVCWLAIDRGSFFEGCLWSDPSEEAPRGGHFPTNFESTPEEDD